MSRGTRQLRIELLQLRPSSTRSICPSCLLNLHRRQLLRHASTSAALASSPTPIASSPPPLSPPVNAKYLKYPLPSPYKIKAGIVLSRPPLITRDLHPFEKSFYLYQRRLNERLALPFTRYFYFVENTPGDIDWKKKIRERAGTAARDIGVYNPHLEDGWNDELLVGAKESEPESQVEALLRDGVIEVEEEIKAEDGTVIETVKKRVEVDRPENRVTEADRTGNLSSLNRALQRTLYLVVKKKDKGAWEFPAGDLEGRENLHRAAERTLVESGGVNMNTWIIGNAPVGHYTGKEPTADMRPEGEVKSEHQGEKTYFMKARIMAGQFDLKASQVGLSGFRWLTKEELEKNLDPVYWKAVRNMLVE